MTDAELKDLQKQIDTLKRRIKKLESKSIPYSPPPEWPQVDQPPEWFCRPIPYSPHGVQMRPGTDCPLEKGKK